MILNTWYFVNKSGTVENSTRRPRHRLPVRKRGTRVTAVVGAPRRPFSDRVRPRDTDTVDALRVSKITTSNPFYVRPSQTDFIRTPAARQRDNSARKVSPPSHVLPQRECQLPASRTSSRTVRFPSSGGSVFVRSANHTTSGRPVVPNLFRRRRRF